jgi:hypothetical protein
MSRRARTVVLAAFAASAALGLSACGADGSLDGSAHAVAPAASTAAPDAATSVPANAVAAPGESAAGGSGSPGAVTAGGAASRGTVSGGRTGGGPGTASDSGSGGGSGGGSGSDGSGGPAKPPAAPAPAAKVTSLRVVQQPTCPVHGTPDAPYSSPGTDVVIAWSVSGAPGAALAVDNPGIYGAYGSDYPASGKLTLAFGCDGQGTTSHSYTVWPAGTHDVSRTITVSAHSDG